MLAASMDTGHPWVPWLHMRILDSYKFMSSDKFHQRPLGVLHQRTCVQLSSDCRVGFQGQVGAERRGRDCRGGDSSAPGPVTWYHCGEGNHHGIANKWREQLGAVVLWFLFQHGFVNVDGCFFEEFQSLIKVLLNCWWMVLWRCSTMVVYYEWRLQCLMRWIEVLYFDKRSHRWWFMFMYPWQSNRSFRAPLVPMTFTNGSTLEQLSTALMIVDMHDSLFSSLKMCVFNPVLICLPCCWSHPQIVDCHPLPKNYLPW